MHDHTITALLHQYAVHLVHCEIFDVNYWNITQNAITFIIVSTYILIAMGYLLLFLYIKIHIHDLYVFNVRFKLHVSDACNTV